MATPEKHSFQGQRWTELPKRDTGQWRAIIPVKTLQKLKERSSHRTLGVLVDSLEEVALGQVRRDEGGGGR